MNIEQLRELEKTGTYLFHGTSRIINGNFEPRQAYTLRNRINVKDGEPAIYATPLLDLAIFMATVTPKNAPKNFHSRFNRDQNGINLLMNSDTRGQLNENSSGYLYVFNKKDFKERSPIEFFSNVKVSPIECCDVKFGDLILEVKVFE
jgi:hypothetical protein